MTFRLLILALALVHATAASAQSSSSGLDLGATFVTTSSGQFHTRDIGGGGWLAWRVTPTVAVEGEITYHADPFGDAVSFYKGRVEGLFGTTVGPRLGAVRPFVSARPGVVRFVPRNEPIVCIAIFPPPLSCTLAAGRTVFAFDLGGGLEVSPSERTVIRVALSDRMLRYPSTAIDTSGVPHDDSFFGHDPRVAIGAGVRF